MNAELSQRVAKLMHTETIESLSPDARVAFADEVSNANSFEALSEPTQRLILQAEESDKS